jgi:hypothetical protein
MERVKMIESLRVGLLPDTFVKSFPEESVLVLWMTREEETLRPSVAEIIAYREEDESSKVSLCDECERLKLRCQALEARIGELETNNIK